MRRAAIAISFGAVLCGVMAPAASTPEGAEVRPRLIVAALTESVAPASPASEREPDRPPQFVVVSFDGAGDPELFASWRAVARHAAARFTYFLSAPYLLSWQRRGVYRGPHHAAGTSDIGFGGTEEDVAALAGELDTAFAEGDEIATHFGGHFCAPGIAHVATWTEDDWRQELTSVRSILFAERRQRFTPRDVVGARAPCLESTRAELRALASLDFRYDASATADADTWPWREAGVWRFPLALIERVGSGQRNLSMDYNFYVAESDEEQMYRSYLRYFEDEYHGARAPVSIGHHFTTWNDGAYVRALERFVAHVCALAEVRCVSYIELVRWLDAADAATLARYREGDFVRFTSPAAEVR